MARFCFFGQEMGSEVMPPLLGCTHTAKQGRALSFGKVEAATFAVWCYGEGKAQ